MIRTVFPTGLPPWEMHACQIMMTPVSCKGIEGSDSYSQGRALTRYVSTLQHKGAAKNHGGWMSAFSRRCLSTEQTSDNVIFDREEATGLAVVKLNKKPVNSMSLEMLTDLSLTLEKLENDKTCLGMILTSANPGVFSAGLDILEMYQPEEGRLREFWRTLQEVFIRLYGSRLITMAAINGHAPAGGCLLSICCDYRVMASPKFTIGLNETQLGIVPPFWFVETFMSTCGQRTAEHYLQLGRMLTSEEALKCQLVDELADIGQVQQKAREQIEIWMKIPGLARQLTKSLIRSPLIQRLESKREEDINGFVKFITREPVQKALGIYLERLKAKKT